MPEHSSLRPDARPRLTHLTVRNFKSIKNLDLDLPSFGVFVGPNGAGKTNLIQAMSLLGDILDAGSSDPARDAGWSEIIRREKKPARSGLTLGARVMVPDRWLRHRIPPSRRVPEDGRAIVIDVSVTLGGRKESQRVEILKEVLTLRAGEDPRVVFSATAEGPSAPIIEVFDDSSLAEFLGTPKGQSVGTLLGDLFGPHQLELVLRGDAQADEERRFLRLFGPSRGYRLPWTQAVTRATSVQRFRLDATSLRSDSPAELRGRFLLDATGRGLAAAVAKLRGLDVKPSKEFESTLGTLRRVYSRIEDVRPVRITSGRLSLQFKERGISEPLDQSAVSDGVLHALALLIALRGREEGILAIEEPENAIHPWSVRAIIDHAQRSGRQSFLTTHSETVVSAIADPSALFIVEQTDEGTVVEAAPSRERAISSILQESGQRLGDVWMDGSLGGVPGDHP